MIAMASLSISSSNSLRSINYLDGTYCLSMMGEARMSYKIERSELVTMRISNRSSGGNLLNGSMMGDGWSLHAVEISDTKI